MPTKPKLPLLLSALVLAVLLAFPAAASATLAYVRNPFHPAVYVANDDGSGARKLDSGETPHVSPDGSTIAYLHQGPKNAQELKLAPAAGGPARTLMVGWREPFSLAWSPDSSMILAQRGPELGMRKLVLIEVATGAQKVVAQGFFSGFSFSPQGGQFVFAKAKSEKFPPRSDVYRVDLIPPGAVSVMPVLPHQITSDHRSSYPLWGPTGRIVFVKTVDAKKRKYAPKNELYLMSPNGKGVKRLTHTDVPQLLQGLFPTDWSASGNRLLAEFEGQDTSYAVRVNPKTGAQKPVGRAGEQGFVGTALSSDGKLVLGVTGGFEPGPNHDVVSISYAGGKPKVLAEDAFEADWSL
jgi:dipeptidyl aminopeptidase/acylaminoacyl peptidase